MSAIAFDKIIGMIRSFDFLSQDVIAKWEQNLPLIPESFYPLLLRTFDGVKHEIDDLYTEFELNRDWDNEYRELINKKSSQAIRLVKALKLKEASGLIGL